jgi:hypothetical protein
MTNPSITHASPTSPYVIAASKAVVAELVLAAQALESRFVNLTVDDPSGLVIELVQTGVPSRTVTVVGPSGGDLSVPGFQVSWASATAGPSTTYTLTVADQTGAGFAGSPWTVRARTPAPTNWAFAPEVTAGVALSRVMCDPVAVLTTSVGTSVAEKSPIQLTAASATIGTVVGGPPPDVSYRFASIGSTAMSPLPVCSASPFLAFTAPGVQADVTVGLQVRVAFADCASAGTAWLTNTSPSTALTIRRRPQHVAVLLDRSGSMTGDRWTNAVAGARAIVRLFATFRTGVHPGDRISLVAFEGPGCSWGTATPPLTPALLTLSDPATADASICATALGNPGSCTPLGQGLVAAMDLLGAGGQPADVRYTLVAMTDGFENDGPVQVAPGTPPPGVQSFAVARTGTSARAFVNARMALFTIGLGSTVDEPVLNNLALGAEAGKFLKVTDPRQLAAAFGAMMSFSQEANPLPTTAAGAGIRFLSSAGADRLGLVVLNPAGGVQVGLRPAGSVGGFTAGPVPSSCPAVGGVTVSTVSVPDVSALGFPGAVEWEVTSSVGPLTAADVLAFEDLQLKADLVLDRATYRVGDVMQATVHLRDGGDPVTGASVRMRLEAPMAGLGEELARYGADYRPRPLDQPDPPTGKGLMLASLLRDRQVPGLPVGPVNGIFIDGTNDLRDPDGTGDYTNTFARFDHEGTYTWEIIAEGTDGRGEPFQRLLTLSTWAGLRIDPRTSSVTQTPVPQHPSGLTAVVVTVTPRDAQGRHLGPFWDADVLFAVTDGEWEKAQGGGPAVQVAFDGTYRRTVLYRENQVPVVTVTVLGTEIGPIPLPPGHPKDLPKDLPKDPPKELPKDPPKDVPKDLPKDPPKDPPKDRPKDPPKDRPKEFVKEPRKDTVKEGVKDSMRPKEQVKDLRDEVVKKDPPDELLKPPPRDILVKRPGLDNDIDPFTEEGWRWLLDVLLPGQPAGDLRPFTLATGPEAADDAPAAAGPQPTPADVRSEIESYRPALARFAWLHARGLLGPEDLAAWQLLATRLQQLVVERAAPPENPPEGESGASEPGVPQDGPA